MNIKEASMATNVSVRALRYYEEIGLIHPVRTSESGYREYDAKLVRRARLIRAYRELQFSLEEIKSLLDAPRMERDAMLQRQIERLEAKRKVIDNRIALAISLRMNGPERFADIDFDQVDAQMNQMNQIIETNAEWQAVSARINALSNEQGEAASEELAKYLAAVASVDESGVPSAICKLIQFIEENFYPCTDQILTAYARSFGGDGLLAEEIEEIAGPGSARVLRKRMETYIKNTACK